MDCLAATGPYQALAELFPYPFNSAIARLGKVLFPTGKNEDASVKLCRYRISVMVRSAVQ